MFEVVAIAALVLAAMTFVSVPMLVFWVVSRQKAQERDFVAKVEEEWTPKIKALDEILKDWLKTKQDLAALQKDLNALKMMKEYNPTALKDRLGQR